MVYEPGGLCVNKKGDVFVPVFGDSKVYEYAHGGTKQIAVLNSPYSVNACAIDPKTQNLAAASYFGAIIFPYTRTGHYRFAKYYRDPVVYYGAYCTYDGHGNLFMDGSVDGPDGFALSELQRGSKTFELVTLDQHIRGPGAMQWRNNILTIADRGKYTGTKNVRSFIDSRSTAARGPRSALRTYKALPTTTSFNTGKRVIGPRPVRRRASAYGITRGAAPRLKLSLDRLRTG